MRKLAQHLTVGVVALVALGIGFYLGAPRLTDPSPDAGAKLRSLAFADLQGATHRIQDWQGKIRIINFWATWCAPCVEEMPLLEQFQREQQANGVQLLGIGIDNAENMQKFREKLQISFPLLVGGPESLSLIRDLGNSAGALPFSVFLTADGRLAGIHLGALTRENLLEAVARADGAPKP